MAARDTAQRWVFGRPGGLRRRAWRAALQAVVGLLREPGAVPPTPAEGAVGEGTRLTSAAGLAPGSVTEAFLDGEPVVVCRTDDGVYVVENTCPHAGGSLGDGALRDGVLTCPDHGWPFDVRTGRCTLSRDVSVRRWRAWIADGDVFVDREPLPPVA